MPIIILLLLLLYILNHSIGNHSYKKCPECERNINATKCHLKSLFFSQIQSLLLYYGMCMDMRYAYFCNWLMIERLKSPWMFVRLKKNLFSIIETQFINNFIRMMTTKIFSKKKKHLLKNIKFIIKNTQHVEHETII